MNLDCKLDLKAIALHARNAEYNPKRCAAVIMRIREPKSTALIFASGKMVCTGAKSEQESRLAARKVGRQGRAGRRAAAAEQQHRGGAAWLPLAGGPASPAAAPVPPPPPTPTLTL